MSADKQMEVSVFQKAKKENYYCGDSYFFIESENEFLCALADGLGSGEYAKESSQIVMDIIEKNIGASVKDIINKCRQGLVGKRGVVIGVLKIDFSKKTYTFSSIGNIGIVTITSDQVRKRNVPNTGYLGSYERPVKVLQDSLATGMYFIMFSDGVSSKELSSVYTKGKDVHKITESYSLQCEQERNDDTTLIAMKYS